ncbi:M50 family metallopeptidase [Ferviditalea candida]|uniref:M50 family metallopeptidase n=1 Tax=Ferviditalea candida TaxID=3108399 RepID=A0ABU5ZGD9_9BACL|nr:M50 family metallopeptidase [Paenibacillaceae bacterium T2]
MIKLLGTTYRLHPLFLMVMAVSLLTGYFVELVTLFGIVVIHEWGHVAAARSFGWKVREIQLLPFGGVAVMDDQGQGSAWQEIVVYLAGPMQNALMIGLSLLLQQTAVWDQQWGNYFLESNLIIGLFNLSPILPLDGGKIMQSLMSLWLNYYSALMFSIWTSLISSAVVIAYALAGWHSAGIRLNLLVIGCFLLYSNWFDYRNLPYLFLRFLVKREFWLSRTIGKGAEARPIVVNGGNTVSHILRRFHRNKVHIIYVLNDKGAIQGILPEHRVISGFLSDHKPGSAVSELFM